jgi:hypothetical protein
MTLSLHWNWSLHRNAKVYALTDNDIRPSLHLQLLDLTLDR